MTLPANIRLNVKVNFPAQVAGSGPITISKSNGIWKIGFSIAQLAQQNPPTANYPNDFLIFYDSIAGNFFKAPLSEIGQARAQRSVTSSPIFLLATDQIINVNINAGNPTCALPSAASRFGLPLTFKDVGAQFAAHNLTITPNGADTIDGAASLVLSVNRQGVTLVPFSDGVNSGWAIE